MRQSRSCSNGASRFTVALLSTPLILFFCLASVAAKHTTAPTPLLNGGQPVDWWFVFKFNAEALPGCGGAAQRACLFGGTVQTYKRFSQQFAFASSGDHTLQQGAGCVGDTTTDPLGATFS